MKLPVEPQFVPAAAADPPDPDSVLQDSGSAPAAGSSPAPAPPQPTVNHLETWGRTTDKEKKKTLWMSRKRDGKKTGHRNIYTDKMKLRMILFQRVYVLQTVVVFFWPFIVFYIVLNF